MAELIYSALG